MSRSKSMTVWASGGALVGTALAARTWARMRADAAFFVWEGDRPVVEYRGVPLRMPAFYQRSDVFGATHLASYEAIRDLLPTDLLRPVRWMDGRAVVTVGALQHHVVTGEYADGRSGFLTPYGEILVSALVTRRPAARVAPLAAPGQVGAGAFVLHLPVTTLEACELGRRVFGLPKFVADMDFQEEPAYRRVRLSEGGMEILTMTVRPRGRMRVDRSPMALYSTLDGELIETVMPRLGHTQVGLGGGGAVLTLGQHPVADQLRRLDISPTPLMTMNQVDLRAILPAGRAIGRASDYPGYVGADRDRGRYTVRYAGTEPTDQYGPVPRITREMQPVG